MTNKPLDANEWAKIHNSSMLESIVRDVNDERYSDWTREMLLLCKPGWSVLELGCGSGQTSLALAKWGCDVAVLDFSDAVLELASFAALRLGQNIKTIQHDITSAELPSEIKDKHFDVIFSSGLLEHFEPDERVAVLKKFKPICETMISMVPNSASLAYHLGKERQEEAGAWIWGREIPVHTQIKEFYKAGYEVEAEYTIGHLHALQFLEDGDELRLVLSKLWRTRQNKERPDKTDISFHQGYLVVTIGGGGG